MKNNMQNDNLIKSLSLFLIHASLTFPISVNDLLNFLYCQWGTNICRSVFYLILSLESLSRKYYNDY